MAINSSFRTLSADNMEGVVYARNYLKNSFENNSTTGWNKVSVSSMSGSVPASGSTISVGFASAVTTFAASATSPLNGKYSLNAASSAAWTAGQGFISDAFAIDRMDAGKVLTVSFDYELVSGTVNMSGTLGSQNFIVYIWDQTAGAWIQPAGFLGMNQSSGPGRVTCTFQSSVTAGQQYRVAVIASVATSGAVSLRFDNFTCSRQTAPIGPVVTDWVSYTPTGSWTTNTTYAGRWRRVGDTIEVDVGLSLTGAPNATSLTVNYLPSGLSIDTAKMTLAQQFIRIGYADGTALPAAYNLKALFNTSISVLMAYQNNLNASEVVVNATAPIAWANGNTIHMRLSVPISGWSSNVQLSNDTDTRVVAFNAYDGAQVAITNTTAVLPLGTTSVDTHAVRSGNTYVIPVSGFYRLSAKSTTKFSVGNTTFTHALIPYKNGVAQFGGDYGNADGVNSANLEFYYQAINSIFRLNAGDIIDFRYFTDYTGVATTYLKYCSIERLSGPSVVAASETVAARYKTTAAQSIPNNIPTPVDFSQTRDLDTHLSYRAGIGYNSTTGTYTTTPGFVVPVSGLYEIGAGAMSQSVAWTAVSNTFIIAATKNGTGIAGSPIIRATTTGTYNFAVAVPPQLVRCNAGDLLNASVYQVRGASTSLEIDADYTYINIKRIGN